MAEADIQMIPLIPYTFIPFGILLGTASICAAISVWITFAPFRAPNRSERRRSAEILYFPAQKARQPMPRAAAGSTNVVSLAGSKNPRFSFPHTLL